MSESLLPEQIIEKKRATWGNLGVAVYHSEIALQLRQQQIEKTLIVPKEISEIQSAEETLKVANRHLTELEQERKAVTSRFDDLAQRLMKPEKSVAIKISDFSKSIIELKRKAAEQEKKNQKKTEELKQIANRVRIYVAEMNATYLKQHAKLISDSYIHALNKISPENLEEYLTKVKGRITLANTKMPTPQLTAQFATQEEVNEEITRTFKPISAKEYVDGFVKDLELKYADYKLAWENKPQALELNEKEKNENEYAIELQKSDDVVAANVKALAQTPTVIGGGKRLKEVYKLAMQETFEDANTIIMAYLANKQKCLDELRVTKWFGFSVKQMMGALEKLKNDDNKFNFEGLIWTIEDKL